MSEAGSTLDTSGWRFPQLPKRPVGRDLVSLALPPFRCQLIRRRDRHLLQSSAPRYMVGSGSFSARDDHRRDTCQVHRVSASGAARRIRSVHRHRAPLRSCSQRSTPRREYVEDTDRLDRVSLWIAVFTGYAVAALGPEPRSTPRGCVDCATIKVILGRRKCVPPTPGEALVFSRWL